jgi:hypothetical protein
MKKITTSNRTFSSNKLLFYPCITFTLLLLTPIASLANNDPTFLNPIEIKVGLTITQIAQSLTALALISVFLERAMEIISKILDEEKKIMKEAQRRKWVPLITLAIGIIISAIGIRGLEPFFTLSNNPQVNLFRFMDIALTGILISGGTSGIHKILTSLTAFLDVTKASSEVEVEKIKAEKIKAETAL